jgi:hypothetical protein
MKEVDKAVAVLDPSVRGEAFAMMEDYILGETADSPASAPSITPRSRSRGGGASDEPDSFFGDREMKLPKDAALGIAGYLYAQYGTEPFTLKEVEEVADKVGLTIPDRLYMTFSGSRRDGKDLFRNTKKGWVPTVRGQKALKDEVGVTKGRKKRPVDEAS